MEIWCSDRIGLVMDINIMFIYILFIFSLLRDIERLTNILVAEENDIYMFENQLIRDNKLLPWIHDQGLIEPANGDVLFIINNVDVIASQ